MSACAACGEFNSEKGHACQRCILLYPPTLIRACVEPGQYLLRTLDHSETPDSFTGAKIHGRWVTIRATEGANVDIQIEHIVWVLDAKEINQAADADDEQPVRDGKHKRGCVALADSESVMSADSDPWVRVLDEDRKPIYERCRYCKAERDISDQAKKDAQLARVAPKRKGNSGIR